MRDFFAEMFGREPPNPMEAARRGMRPPLRARFYRDAEVAESGKVEGGAGRAKGFAVLLDDKPVRTPARHLLTAPTRELAEAIAAEWREQAEHIEPATMPLTRLANAIIDGASADPKPVRAEIKKYLGTDLLFYRASGPEGLVIRQAQHWDPVLAWARESLGANFVLADGVMHAAQPQEAVAAAVAAIPIAANDARELWRLGAISVVTTLTGSALLALALAAGRLDAGAVWAAAHVDEDWNMEFWGRDEIVLKQRAYRFAELQAAAMVLSLLA